VLLNDNDITNAGATLGRVLFYDRRLSITNTHACASCHLQSHGFASPDQFSTGVVSVPLARNAMGLTNVRFNFFNVHFSDERVESLERLVLFPIQEDLELASPLDDAVQKVREAPFYGPLFEAAFGSPDITPTRIARALSQFLRSLLAYRAKFDRAYHVMNEGDVADPAAVLTLQELRGAELFVSSKCDLCHQNDVHLTSTQNNGLDAQVTDPGVAGDGRFRAASLRNVALTAPYMHDGRFSTLREVIDFYDHGVQLSGSLSPILNNFGQEFRLNLSEDDKQALEAFLHTLTDEAFLQDSRFADPFQ
jgi:cytochrome c peroxidase